MKRIPLLILIPGGKQKKRFFFAKGADYITIRHMKKLMELYGRYRHFVNYFFFGCVTTFVNWLAYAVLTGLAHVDYRLANILAWLISVSVAFYTNRRWVFEGDDANIAREMARFFAARAFTGAVEIVLLPALGGWGLTMSRLGVENFVAKILVTVNTTVLNYVFSRLYIFRGARK